MKVLLANPPCKYEINSKYEKYFIRAGSRWPHSGVKKKKDIPHYLPFPFYLAYSAALLRNSGFEVYVIDAIALDISESEFIQRIKNIKPEIILFEVTTPTIDYDLQLVEKIKVAGVPNIVIAGAHATTYAREILQNSKNIDFILKGEYEFSLLTLAKSLREGRFSGCPGIVMRKNGGVEDNGFAPLTEPLNNLPPPARDLFPSNDKSDPTIYWDGFCQKRPAIQMHASRGCPYKCSFCLWNQVMYRNGKYRTFTSDRVVEEMADVVQKYNAREIYFDDDDFTINKRFVLEICNKIMDRHLKVSWSCMGDAINLDEEIIKTMAQSGCIGIKFGVESGSEEMLKNLGKPINLKKVYDVAKMCAKYGIKSHATFSLGLPGETEKTIKETIKFANKLDVDTIQLSICTPFPGTKFFEEVKNQGLLKSKDWQKYDGKASEVVSYPELDLMMVEKIMKKSLLRWFVYKFFSFSWFFRQLRNVYRSIKGLGIKFFFKQINSIIIDEMRNV
ncbi:MAG: radical SAM protein [Elusimicrobia bacterium]|nr:radical SAM protein [Elusimicrobiota bacterium]